jgi:hypothetical protein
VTQLDQRDVTVAEMDAFAAGMLPRAIDLVCQVRDRDADAVEEIIGPLSVVGLRALVVVLAAMVPDDQNADDLLAWTHEPSLGPGPLPPVTPEQARENLRRLAASIGAVHQAAPDREDQ